ncbi:UDP-N-acetylmuramoyl-L-alanine--D-glutamate ligase [Orrella marina]|uniref:UDP-N-acetylmuramoylalanine--D-glutamate ligase n=1 Tax=Orrella marina TaxID=2163011 RepID=A0A2R4XKE0_9BURK|nr:UDP-N-acetylmuramoyl-L-alanine--D-glutamate ligase [Orrella marina]AWB34277.1 UDP-N-acetylmuramoyl-L-alanine--D-glutamate ligase [Orrella marina]
MSTQLNPSREDRIALVIGLGQTGAASARWLKRQGFDVRLLDTRENPPGSEALFSEIGSDMVVHFGRQEPPETLFEAVTLAVISPGLSPDEHPVKAWLEHLKHAGAQIVGEMELFARALQDLQADRQYTPKVLGVTGTNGKTTVTALTRRMVETSGWSTVAAGNISPAALDALMMVLDTDALPEVWVLELSSFQLMTTQSLRMTAATVLNVSQDHLDWHGTMQAYCDAKSRILDMAQIKIVNRDDPAVMAMVPASDSLHVRSFGGGVPALTGDLGLQSQQGMVWLVEVQATEFDDAPRPRRRKSDPEPVRESGRQVRLMPAEALALVGHHNALNVLAAACLARAAGVAWTPILKAASDYDGEPHRMRFVRTVREVDFYNDSKGTNVGATLAGIEGLGKQVVLIAGGLAKGQDFEPLAKALARHGGQAVLMGTDAQLLCDTFEARGVRCARADSMDSAVQTAFALADPGQVVLLSPACASFDMFKGYGHRGDMFVDAVHELALAQGEVA